MTKVRNLLERKDQVLYAIEPEAPVLAAIEQMATHSIGALLVMQGEQLLGIVSERDYARKVILLGRSSAETPVWMIMSAPVTQVAPDESINTCMLLMTEKKFRHLPVVEHGRVIGMLSIGDLVKRIIDDQATEIDQLQRYIAS
ncbi:MAG: histidine kinase [Lysobacterales bacterium CG02_land_8_20_14_3_00_62_12]|nr:MAG: histidine kinase [Xanthomonadales bacterium CG02_land_8_20_14_3_00_62_12]PJA42137.1 MAG: histidine kinase [Xanthomonadales bacterium CG_4_9_14_3_um_filter_62_6]